MPTAQTDFPFVSLDFPGRTALTVDEIAERLGVTAQHVIDQIVGNRLRPLTRGGSVGISTSS